MNGVDFAPEDRVFLMFGSANRDEAHFADADEFDLTRDTAKSIAFGAGPHFCAGAAASRAMIADVALPSVFARLKGLRLDEREPVRIGGWAFRGLFNLPVGWERIRLPLVPAKAGTQSPAKKELDARFRGHERESFSSSARRRARGCCCASCRCRSAPGRSRRSARRNRACRRSCAPVSLAICLHQARIGDVLHEHRRDLLLRICAMILATSLAEACDSVETPCGAMNAMP